MGNELERGTNKLPENRLTDHEKCLSRGRFIPHEPRKKDSFFKYMMPVNNGDMPLIHLPVLLMEFAQNLIAFVLIQ